MTGRVRSRGGCVGCVAARRVAAGRVPPTDAGWGRQGAVAQRLGNAGHFFLFQIQCPCVFVIIDLRRGLSGWLWPCFWLGRYPAL